jgi:hypothetical protein
MLNVPGWKLRRHEPGGPLDGWGNTARYCVIVLTERAPGVISTAIIWLAMRR